MEYWETYMQKVSNSLNKNGIAVIQTITIDASVFEKYTKTSDFIRHFIFPGGMLPTKEIFEIIAQKFGFEVVASENFGMSYRQTLLLWLENFDKISHQLSPLGFDEKFIRKWRFYLAYCAAGFNSKRTDVYQFVLRKI
jgi:cyclopropane-fatty-acyl-phospholipid synthase